LAELVELFLRTVRADDFDSGEARRIVSWIDHLLGLID
jgi:hypothetical protein